MMNFNEKIVFRKFLLDNTYFFLLCSLSLSLIVWIVQAVNFLDFISEDGHSFDIYFYFTVLNFPKIFKNILPIIFFISLFYTITKYEENNELKIFWINGINKVKLINVLIKYTFLFFFLQIFLTTLLSPALQGKARSYLKEYNMDFFPSLLQEKKFIDTVSNLTIFVDSKDENGNFNKIFLKDKLNSKIEKFQIIYAEKGTIQSENNDKFLVLHNGEIITIKPNANVNEKSTKISFETTKLNLAKFSTKTTTFPKIQELSTFILASCLNSNPEKKFKNKYLQCNERTKPFVVQEFFKRIYLPIYIPLLMLIACLQITKSKDNFDYNRFKFILFLYAVLILSLSEISIRYIANKNIYEKIFLILPIFLFLLNYLFLKKKLSVRLTN